MADRIQALLEAERRGILPDDMRPYLEEARRRNLVPAQATQVEALEIDPERREARSLSAFDETYVAPIPSREQLGENLRRTGRGLDDLVRSIASGATFNMADEAAAGMNTLTGLGPGETYSENLQAERARDEAINPMVRAIGGAGGALATGTGLARGGATLLRGARPTVTSMGTRGATEGALYGAAHGFGAGEGLQNRIDRAAEAAGIGALAGGLVGGGAGAVASRATRTPPTVKELYNQGDAIYKRVLDTGRRMDQTAYSSMVDDLTNIANQRSIPENSPRVFAALDALSKRKGQAPTLREVDNLRIKLRDAGDSATKSERNLANRLVRQLDQYMETVMPEIVPARRLWQRASKGEEIQNIIRSARKKANRYTGSGYENALRREFTRLADSPKRLRGFSEAEVRIIERVGEGGSVGNALRELGKLAPTGVVSGSAGMGGGYGLANVAGIDPVIGMIGLPAAGTVGRIGATAATARNARLAEEFMRAGGVPYQAPLNPVLARVLEERTRAGGIMGGFGASQ